MNTTCNDTLRRFFNESRWIETLDDLQEQLVERRGEIENAFLEIEPQTRLLAAGALAYLDQLQADRLLPVLMQGLASTDDGNRAYAAHCISLLANAATPAVPILIQLLKDDDCIVVECAIRALGEIGSPDSVPFLTELLGMIGTTDDAIPTSLAQDAAMALGRIGPAAHAAVPKLRECLQLDGAGDPFIQSLRLAAARAIWQITSVADIAVAVASELIGDEDDYVCLEACRVLSELGKAAKPAAHDLQRLLKHADASVREEAAKALVGCWFGQSPPRPRSTA